MTSVRGLAQRRQSVRARHRPEARRHKTMVPLQWGALAKDPSLRLVFPPSPPPEDWEQLDDWSPPRVELSVRPTPFEDEA